MTTQTAIATTSKKNIPFWASEVLRLLALCVPEEGIRWRPEIDIGEDAGEGEGKEEGERENEDEEEEVGDLEEEDERDRQSTLDGTSMHWKLKAFWWPKSE